jgi:hypothetical protein
MKYCRSFGSAVLDLEYTGVVPASASYIYGKAPYITPGRGGWGGGGAWRVRGVVAYMQRATAHEATDENFSKRLNHQSLKTQESGFINCLWPLGPCLVRCSAVHWLAGHRIYIGLPRRSLPLLPGQMWMFLPGKCSVCEYNPPSCNSQPQQPTPPSSWSLIRHHESEHHEPELQ